MNDKTAQSMADELRLAAPSGDMAGLNGWGNLCNEAADAIDNLRAEKDRLMTCLEKANISTEHFEREWYLRGDELDNLRAQLAEVEKQRDYAIHQAQIWKLEAASQKALRAAIDAAKGESDA